MDSNLYTDNSDLMTNYWNYSGCQTRDTLDFTDNPQVLFYALNENQFFIAYISLWKAVL